jgi:hypothetical protein
LGFFLCCEPARGPWLSLETLILTLQGRRRALNTALCNKYFFDWWAY